MYRLARMAVPLAVVMAALLQSPVSAATRNVTIGDPFFQPSTLNARLGDSVLWTNTGNAVHSSRGLLPYRYWDSPPMSAGQFFSFTFIAGGIYTYECRFHPKRMKGSIGVPDEVQPPGGVIGTTFTITVATVDAPAGFVYDVQMKAPGPGTQFQDWMMGVTTATVTFDSTGQPAGTYQFHSRLTRLVDGSSSLYSPPASIVVIT